MPPLTLPLSFTNSFWSQDYRHGLHVLYGKLQQGIDENDELVAFLKTRIMAERTFAAAMIPPPTNQGSGFEADDGAGLRMAFRGLQNETIAQAAAHRALANDLQDQVLDPFEVWAHEHSERIHQSRADILDGWLADYEASIGEVGRLKESYLLKGRKADEAEDDVKFAPGGISDAQTKPGNAVQRSGTVTERISSRMKALGLQGSVSSSTETSPTSAKSDKGKGKEISDSPKTMSPASRQLPELTVNVVEEPGILSLGDLTVPASAMSALLFRAQSELPLRSVRFTLLGEYENCFSGEELATWLKDQVPGLNGDLDRAELVAADLAERENVFRRVGEFGNKFENSPTAYYQFRPKAFNLTSPARSNTTAEEATPFSPVATNLLKRSNTVVSYLQKTLAAPPAEHLHVKARMEADAADQTYKRAVRKLDQARLVVEDKVEEMLKVLQRWETDRLRAIKTVLLQYQGIVAALSSPLQQSNETSSMLISSFMPESDVNALIERYRTGPFRPVPHVYESLSYEGTDVCFGLDLRKWAAEGAWSYTKSATLELPSHEDLKPKEPIPLVISGLLTGLNEAYAKLASDDDRRKTWIYEIPLASVHHLRERLNALPLESPIPMELLARYDAPVLAGTIKLWALELNPPLALWEGWDDIRKIYPSVGADSTINRNLVEELKTALIRIPKVHLLVLDALISHLKSLVDHTATEEPNDVYLTKLSLSMGRSIIRPRVESNASITDRHPQLLIADLIKNYDQILPPTLSKKQRESDRVVPTRKRTKMVDVRLSRRSIDASSDPRKLLEAQFAMQTGRSPSPAPPTGGRPTFVSPPTSPQNTSDNRTTSPSVSTTLAPPTRPAGTPIVVDPPTPVSLNEPVPVRPNPPPFVPPPPPPTIASAPKDSSGRPPAFASPPPSPPSESGDLPNPFSAPAPAAAEPPSSQEPSPKYTSPTLQRGQSPIRRTSLSNESPFNKTNSGAAADSRMRGPRGPAPAPARGPRPLNSQMNMSSSGGLVRPSQILASARGRGSPGPETGRRTPPNPSEYAPRGKVGRASAGSFSRTTKAVASGSEDEGAR